MIHPRTKVSIATLAAVLACASAWTAAPLPLSSRGSGNPLTRRHAIAVPLPGDESTSTGSSTTTTTPSSERQLPSLAPADAWVAQMDYDGFQKDVNALGKELLREGGDADVDHLLKLVSWRNVAALVGLATIGATPNPITIAALSTWTYASWTMIAHHTCHGGYNRLAKARDETRFNSRSFGLGLLNRVVDWLDWMQPEAWNLEHNRLHHYRLNEAKDPDLVQRNLDFLRDIRWMPLPLKYAYVGLVMCVWKWFYYAPNTYKELKINEWKMKGQALPADMDPEEAMTLLTMLRPGNGSLRQVVNPIKFWVTVMGPMLVGRILALPALLWALPISGSATLASHALVNLLLADVLTNIHSFITIVTNHAGNDMYTFDDGVKPRSGSFYVRQVIGSANYEYGTDAVDFAHGFLNYQIEHHVWPDLSMLQYQKGAPKLRALCEQYGVPYVKESVWTRLRKTVDIMVGRASMRPFPTQYEPAKDKSAVIEWKSTNGSIDGDDRV